MFEDMIKFGRELFIQGLNDSHSGNISVRRGDRIYITRHGARTGDLSFGDIVAVNLNDAKKDGVASMETKVHRAIYLGNPAAGAVIHAHPPHAIALSLKFDKIMPVDAEGEYYFPEIPVFSECADTISSDCVASRLPAMFAKHKIVVVKGHGSFAAGKDLEEAYLYTSACESASKIAVLDRLLRSI